MVFPPHHFTACCGDHLRLTLKQLVLPRRFYNINNTNQIFYLRNIAGANDTYHEVTIPTGTYATLTELAAAIQAGLQAAVTSGATQTTSCLCGVTTDGSRLTFTLTGLNSEVFPVCFQSKGTRPVGVSEQGFFQQTHKILGAKPTRTDDIINAIIIKGNTANTMPYLPSLSTLDCVYLRSNLQGKAFQSTGHERFLPSGNWNQLVQSQIWARIPILDPTDPFPIVYDDTGGDMFVLEPHMHNLDQLELWLTDEFGNNLPEDTAGQTDDGMLAFTCVIRVDVMTPSRMHSAQFVTRPANLFSNTNIPTP